MLSLQLCTLAILQGLNGCLEESSISDPGGSFCFPLLTGSISPNNRGAVFGFLCDAKHHYRFQNTKWHLAEI